MQRNADVQNGLDGSLYGVWGYVGDVATDAPTIEINTTTKKIIFKINAALDTRVNASGTVPGEILYHETGDEVDNVLEDLVALVKAGSSQFRLAPCIIPTWVLRDGGDVSKLLAISAATAIANEGNNGLIDTSVADVATAVVGPQEKTDLFFKSRLAGTNAFPSSYDQDISRTEPGQSTTLPITPTITAIRTKIGNAGGNITFDVYVYDLDDNGNVTLRRTVNYTGSVDDAQQTYTNTIVGERGKSLLVYVVCANEPDAVAVEVDGSYV